MIDKINYYIKELSKLELDTFQSFYNKKNKYISKAHFFEDKDIITIKYLAGNKKVLIKKYNNLIINLRDIWSTIKNDRKIDTKYSKYFIKDIKNKISKLKFLIHVYDVESHKLNKNYNIDVLNYDNVFYNNYSKKIYGITRKDIISTHDYVLFPKRRNDISYNNLFSKHDLENLIIIISKLLPSSLSFKFSKNIGNMFHNCWEIIIPDQEKYSIKEIIVIFFHEVTHFIRYYNSKINIWFDYKFYDYNDFEEWLAIYNEYKYWNLIVDIWEYMPIYDILYNILLSEESTISKKRKFKRLCMYYRIPEYKINNLYKRFHRYTFQWQNKFLFKEIVYNKSYKKVNYWIKNKKASMADLLKFRSGCKSFYLFWKFLSWNSVNADDYFLNAVQIISSYIKDNK